MQMVGLARLGRDAEMRHTQDGTAVASLSLAFNYGKKDQDGNRPTQWVDGSLWGKAAEVLTEYLVKGQAVVVTIDDPHVEEYEKRDGTIGTKLAGRVSNIELAGKRDDATPRNAAPPARSPAPAAAPTPARRAPAPAAAASRSGFDDVDDDIPF